MRINKFYKRLFISTLVLIMMFSVGYFHKVKAAIFGISAVNNGNGTATVTIYGECVGGFTVSGGGSSVNVPKSTLTSNAVVTLNTGAGTFTITATAISVSDAGYNLVDGSVSTVVKVTVPDSGNNNNSNNNGNNNSNNNNSGSGNNNTDTPPDKENQDDKSSESMLSSLSVSKGKLSPDFDENITSYNLGLTSDITSIEVKAKAKDDKAAVSGTGKHDLKAGKTDINIAVTAENGSTRTYTIHVTVEEKPKEFVKYNGQKLGILTNLDEVTPPAGFEKAKVKVSGKERDGWYNASSKIYLVYLADKDMIKNFYMVENNQVTSIYKPVQLLGKSLVIIDVPDMLQEKNGMKFTTVTIDKQKLKGWIFKDKNFKNYSLIYVMDTKGRINYYQYEKTEETLQLYSGAAPITAHDYEKEKADSGNSWLIYTGLGSSAVLLAVLIYTYLRNKKNVAYLMTQRRLNYRNEEDES